MQKLGKQLGDISIVVAEKISAYGNGSTGNGPVVIAPGTYELTNARQSDNGLIAQCAQIHPEFEIQFPLGRFEILTHNDQYVRFEVCISLANQTSISKIREQIVHAINAISDEKRIHPGIKSCYNVRLIQNSDVDQ
jgi:hypothetical protein